MEDKVKITMLKIDFEALPKEIRAKMMVEVVEVDFDYSKDELWNDLAKKSKEAYRALKEREFKLRHP